MKYSKKFELAERNRLYAIYVYFRYFDIESFEKFCRYYFKKVEQELTSQNMKFITRLGNNN